MDILGIKPLGLQPGISSWLHKFIDDALGNPPAMDFDDGRVIGLYVDGNPEPDDIETNRINLPVPSDGPAEANCITCRDAGFLKRLRDLLPLDCILYIGDESKSQRSTLLVFSWPKSLASAMRGTR
jgi:hypothetical protein